MSSSLRLLLLRWQALFACTSCSLYGVYKPPKCIYRNQLQIWQICIRLPLYQIRGVLKKTEWEEKTHTMAHWPGLFAEFVNLWTISNRKILLQPRCSMEWRAKIALYWNRMCNYYNITFQTTARKRKRRGRRRQEQWEEDDVLLLAKNNFNWMMPIAFNCFQLCPPFIFALSRLPAKPALGE